MKQPVRFPRHRSNRRVQYVDWMATVVWGVIGVVSIAWIPLVILWMVK